MALIICPECGGKVSDKAPACVHCGYPIGSADIMNAKMDSVEITQEIKDKFNSLPTYYLNNETGHLDTHGKNIKEKLKIIFDLGGIDIDSDIAEEFMLDILKKISSNAELDILAFEYRFWFLKGFYFEESHKGINRDKVRFKIALDRGAIPFEEVISAGTAGMNIGYVKETKRCLAASVFGIICGMEEFGMGHVDCLGYIKNPNDGKNFGEAYIVHESAKNINYTADELEYCKIYSKYIDACLECAKKLPSDYEMGAYYNDVNYQERYKYELLIPVYAKQNMEAKAARQNALNQLSAMQNPNVPRCSTCGSTDLKKITFANKAGSAYLFGIFATGKASKTWHCNNCGTEW